MTTRYVVFYRQYGNWCSTVPFVTREQADDHCRRNLLDNTVFVGDTAVPLTPNTNRHKELVHVQAIDLPGDEAELAVMASAVDGGVFLP